MEQASTNQQIANDRLVDGSHAAALDFELPANLLGASGRPNDAGSSSSLTNPSSAEHPKDQHTKHGLIKKILRRTANFNSDSKNRIKVIEERSHQLQKQQSGHSQSSSDSHAMGNVHQGTAINESPPAVVIPSSASLTRNSPGSHGVTLNWPNPTATGTTPSEPHPSSHVKLVHTEIMPNGGTMKMNAGEPAQLNETVERLKAALRSRDRRIYELEREVDKLRSVLDQQLTESWARKSFSNVSSTALQTISLNPDRVSAEIPSLDLPPPMNKEGPAVPDDATSTSPVLPSPPATPSIPAAALLLHKRLGVSGESTRKAEELKYYEKDAKSRQQIRDALRSNELLMNLDVVQLQEMVSCMHEQKIPAGCFIIREGDDGEHLYVGAEGEYEVSKGGKRLCLMPAGRCFGELALLYNCKRTASVKALIPSRVWVLERGCFQGIMMKTGMERIEERKAFLRSVPLLKNVPMDRILRIADALEAQYHSPGDCIIRQGELADSFFIIQSGFVNVTITITKESGETVEQNVRQMTKGEYFGEKALLGEGRRTANVYALGPNGVEVLCLYRKDFLELIGDLQELMNKPYLEVESLIGDSSKLPTPASKPTNLGTETEAKPAEPISETLPPVVAPSSPIFQLDQDGAIQAKLPLASTIRITDLEPICVLGVGGFGRVDLVTLANDHSQAFAMKRMQKQHIVQTRQQEHVHFEKLILSSVNSPFICKLYATYRDNKYVYMLMEACLGGELWTILRDSHHLDDRSAKFCLACCIEALEYLHHHGIIYRDLKPENMLVTARGYIKMCDFGFAKYIGIGQKTWTFCGTPEYVAPEVILNKGHDFAADYWSLGILTYELLTGTPPFQASEPIKIYMKTLKGIDALGLAQNKYICLKALQFIRRLCRFNPSERLGVGKHGIQEIRSHKYFQGFDWAAISKQTMTTPFKVKLNGPLDHSNFDRFTMDEQEPPDELSGWDANF